LKDRNIFFQKIKEDEDKDKLPALKESNLSKMGVSSSGMHTGCALNADLDNEQSMMEQYQGNGPKNFFQSLRKSEKAFMISCRRSKK
jgi:hypothetical protein